MIYQAFNETTGNSISDRVRLASRTLDRMIGLLRHSSLGENEGLWISPCNSIQTYFMRFSIDALFLSSSGEILRIYEKIPPFRLTRIVFKARSVLELPAGRAARRGCKPGDVVRFTETP